MTASGIGLVLLVACVLAMDWSWLGGALALAIPTSVPEKNAILVAAFSIFIQGRSMPRMIRTLRLKAC